MENNKKKYRADFNKAQITWFYLHAQNSEEVLIQTFNHQEDNFWSLKIDGHLVRYWDIKDITLGEVIHYANSLIEATI